MATTSLTSNLKLRISSDLTADSRYNLLRLDSLGSIYQIDTNSIAKVRSKTDILIQPNDPDIGGIGSGGTVQFGTTDQPIENFTINATSVSLSSGLSLPDSAVGGTQTLLLNYKSDIDGSANTTANRTLNIDLNDSDRNLLLAGDFSLSGAKLCLTLTSDIDWTLPPDNGTNGQVLTTDGLGSLSWTSSASSSLVGLNDTNINSPQDGEGLVYNSASGFWENGNPTATIGPETAYTWTPADGDTIIITHNLGSRQVVATVIDETDDYKTIEVPETTRPNNNQIILSATSAPSGGNWLVLLKQIIT